MLTYSPFSLGFDNFLSELSRGIANDEYEVVLWTAGQQEQADERLDIVDLRFENCKHHAETKPKFAPANNAQSVLGVQISKSRRCHLLKLCFFYFRRVSSLTAAVVRVGMQKRWSTSVVRLHGVFSLTTVSIRPDTTCRTVRLVFIYIFDSSVIYQRFRSRTTVLILEKTMMMRCLVWLSCFSCCKRSLMCVRRFARFSVSTQMLLLMKMVLTRLELRFHPAGFCNKDTAFFRIFNASSCFTRLIMSFQKVAFLHKHTDSYFFLPHPVAPPTFLRFFACWSGTWSRFPALRYFLSLIMKFTKNCFFAHFIIEKHHRADVFCIRSQCIFKKCTSKTHY